jgi:hypothetical protein
MKFYYGRLQMIFFCASAPHIRIMYAAVRFLKKNHFRSSTANFLQKVVSSGVDIHLGAAIPLGQQITLGLQDIAGALLADGFDLGHWAVQATIRDGDTGGCAARAAKAGDHQRLIGSDAYIHAHNVAMLKMDCKHADA